MPCRKRLEIEHAEQRVAAADVGVEKAERLARLDRLDPERDLRQLDRHRVAVDAVKAGARDIAQRVTVICGRCDASACARRATRVAIRRAAASRKWPEPQAGSMTRNAQAALLQGRPTSASTRSSTGSSALSSSA